MSRTFRWWNNPRIKKLSKKLKELVKFCKTNPFYFRHEAKEVRVYLHRHFRHMNKQNLKKCIDPEKETKTGGWLTH